MRNDSDYEIGFYPKEPFGDKPITFNEIRALRRHGELDDSSRLYFLAKSLKKGQIAYN